MRALLPRAVALLATFTVAGCAAVEIRPASEQPATEQPASPASPTLSVRPATPEPTPTAPPLVPNFELPSPTATAVATVRPTTAPPAPVTAFLDCDVVNSQDVSDALNSTALLGPEWSAFASGAEECRWDTSAGSKVLSVVVFPGEDVDPDWGATRDGSQAHAAYVGINWSDYVNASGGIYRYGLQASMVDTESVAHVLLLSRRDETARAEDIRASLHSLVGDVLVSCP